MMKKIKEYHVGMPYMYARTVPVAMGPGKGVARAFIHANTRPEDPWMESMYIPTDTLKLTLVGDDGNALWTYDFGNGTVPGTWFSPMISFDLDGDGVDEIWTLGNTRPDLPFTQIYRTLMRIDPLTGKVTGEWEWPSENTASNPMDHAYRYYLICGYVHGEPVLICAQGTYEDEFLQGYDKNMNQIWSVCFPMSDKGARASHHTIVFDINGDGVDELFYGERVISLADGSELYCGDKGHFWSHSDILSIFEDPETGKRYVFTAREGQWENLPDEPAAHDRVVLFDDHMNAVWRWNQGGHMHEGWLATVEKEPIPEGGKVIPGENRKYIAHAMSLALDLTNKTKYEGNRLYFYFDAVTGQPIDNPLPDYMGDQVVPIDINGDGYSEFLVTDTTSGAPKPENAGDIMDQKGNIIDHIDGHLLNFGRLVDGYKGQQIMMSDNATGTVTIYADDEAVEGPCDLYAEHHALMQHMMASGYNPRNACFGI